MTVRRGLRLGLCAALGGAALFAASPGPAADAETAPPYLRTVEAWDPAYPPNPGAAPAVDLTAACVRPTRTGGTLEAVFGYTNPGDKSVFTPIEDSPGLVDANVITRTRNRFSQRQRETVVEKFGPQVTLFKPGSFPHSFAVRFKLSETVAWRAFVPANDEGPGFRVTVRPWLLRPCRRDVPAHFAVVQWASAFYDISDIARDPAGAITAYDVSKQVEDARIACSAGGTPAGVVDVVHGWSAGQANLVPLAPEEVLSTANSLEYSRTSSRAVVDVAQRLMIGGFATDVVGECRFPSGAVARDTFWADATYTTIFTPVLDGEGRVVEIDPTAVAPPGVRIR